MENSLLIKNANFKGKSVNIRIKDGVISKISAENLAALPEEKLLDAHDMAVLPAFYNLHTHAAMSLMRGYADDMELFTWLNQHVWPFEAKLKPEDIVAGTKLAILEMIRSGCVHFDDMYWFPLDTALAAKEMGIRARIGLLALNNNSDVEKENARCLERISEFQGPVRFSFSPHAVYTVNGQTLSKAAETCRERNMILHVHASETLQEVEDCKKEHEGLSPVQWLDKLGCLGPKTILAHCVWLDEKDRELMAQRGAWAIHVPGSNMKLSSGIFQYREALKAGVKVALGTDGCCSSNNLSMFATMKEASFLAKVSTMDPTTASAKEVFNLATSQGACAAEVDGGTIAEGKVADLMLTRTDLPEMTPCYNPISNLVYSASSECVDTVVCDGKIIMQNRHVEGEEEIISQAKAAVKRLMAK